MLEHSQLNTAVELSLLLLDHFINAKEEVDEKNLGILLSIFSRFPHTRDNVVRSYILKCIRLVQLAFLDSIFFPRCSTSLTVGHLYPRTMIKATHPCMMHLQGIITNSKITKWHRNIS
eukprot:TRINITY_DN1148_c0_g2_i6.p1 TRINITY_DN1148_c0_g2~~TRINITY_DN1148_c0_g2_i6.p1  ORF type:complete len:118 (+),score=12.17 TRINITY_DN1148_c0_g2_i6:311-664(+)